MESVLSSRKIFVYYKPAKTTSQLSSCQNKEKINDLRLMNKVSIGTISNLF